LVVTIRLGKAQSVREIVPAQEVSVLPKKSRQKVTC